MKRIKFRVIIVFLIAVFISSLLIHNTLAVPSGWEGVIKKLEESEKTPPPEVIVRPKVEYKAGDLKDPFQRYKEEKIPPGAQQKESGLSTPPSLTVQGIIWGGRFPQAIINNKVVKVGDTIEGARVISIDKEGITLLFEGMQYNLPSPAAGALPSKKTGGEDEKNF